MTFASDVGSTFERMMNRHGSTMSIQMKTRSYSGADYDNEILSPSGAVINSYQGVLQPIDSHQHGEDYAYVQQGLVQLTDKKVFVTGKCPLEENVDIVINSGSYYVVKFNIWTISGADIYKKAYLRAVAPEEPVHYG